MTPHEIRPSDGPIDVNVVALSPHVVVYRLWKKDAGAAYGDPLRTWDTADNEPDTVSVGAMPQGSAVGYFLAVSGKPNSPYRAMVSFSQAGHLLTGGTCMHEGNTDSNGYAEQWGEADSV
jgi:hypothetical protein